MKSLSNIEELALTIEQLELQSAKEEILLKQEAKKTYESLRPINLLKKSITDLSTQPDFKSNLLDSGISLLAGYASKKAMIGSTHNPLKQLMGVLLQIVVTKIVSKNTNEIHNTISQIMKKIKNN